MGPRRYYLTLSEAVAELERRRKDLTLRACVEEYLDGDIPECFEDGPILYLARHVATPNQETRAFLELAEHLGYRAVVGQDPDDLFVSHNSLKRSLGKLPIVQGVSHDGKEIIQYVTIIDFNTANGKRLKDVKTFAGTPLIAFHNDLFTHVMGKQPIISNDDTWIDRQHRGDMMEHYKRFLALFAVHGILFEYFLTHDTDEQKLVAEIIVPAFDHVHDVLGVTPLITPPVSPSTDQRNWESYPGHVFDIVQAQTGSV